MECAKTREQDTTPIQEFLASLNNKNKAKIISIISRYAEFGKISNREQFKKVDAVFWEFKSFQIRVFMYHCERGCIALTHGFIKKGDKIPPAEIVRAYKIKELYDEIRRR
ncbi:MAG: type II toxin-antitoxin system RelE/ParE family toxin [Thermodesulfobacteriota bacterium]